MRTSLLLVFLSTVAACGQTGSLYLPDEDVETPVEIRKTGDPQKEKKDEKPAVPPGT
jgi:predicted small lipoprotein YifL